MVTKRHIKLHFRELDGSIQVFVRSDQQPNDVLIDWDLTTEDIKNINRELTDILRRLTRIILSQMNEEGHVKASAKKQIQKEFRALAERGHVCLHDVFGSYGLALLKEMSGDADQVAIEIVSRSIVLPWELLYQDFDSANSNYDNFWGLKYIIHQNIPQPSGVQAPEEEEIQLDKGSVQIGLVADSSLPSVAEVELPFFEQLEKEKTIRLNYPPMSHANNREAWLKNDLLHYFSKEMQIVHFACHTRESAGTKSDPPDEYLLQISRDLYLSRSDFINFKLWFGDSPLVILNACGTSPRNPLTTRNTVREFIRRNARGVITTESLVPDVLAAAFTKLFYPQLLSGKPIGEALLETRRALLCSPYHNPLGLLYALYGYPNTRLV